MSDCLPQHQATPESTPVPAVVGLYFRVCVFLQTHFSDAFIFCISCVLLLVCKRELVILTVLCDFIVYPVLFSWRV